MTCKAADKILLGISGGIAAYKTPDLVRRLRERGAEVQVVMTRAAGSFVAPLSLQAVSGRPVRSALLDPEAEAGMDHIELARWADRLLVAPASAHLIARLAQGLADDLLTTLALATTAPVWLAPAMNHRMWQHPATQANATLLAERGCVFLGPATGSQACGEIGPGRMLETEELAERVLASRSSALANRRVLVTAGPTHEVIDPVRFVGNRSSGKMGYAVAEALADFGADVTLVSGPTALEAPRCVERVFVESAAQMYEAVMARVAGCDLFVSAAAVADYRPLEPAGSKIKKDADSLTLTLVRNPDILADVAALPEAPFTVGFAAETDEVERYASGKLAAKGLDMIAANRVGADKGGFGADDNALTILWRGGRRQLPMMAKTRLGLELAKLIAERYAASLAG
ncbi:MAG: bifunctional phosphopantothenoylcysteine decarboxylase/phosphopantothenate--cysteine ligase CoaBC [Thiohalocapsa sp.]